MPDFYILNDASTVTADNAREAARLYAREQRISGGTVLVAANVKTFSVTAAPAVVEVIET